MSSSPHPITAQQVTEADFLAARNVAYGCLSVLEELPIASGDLGELIYEPSLFACNDFAPRLADPPFSRIARDVDYLGQVLNYAGARSRPGPLAGHQVDWNDAEGPEKLERVKPWLLPVAEGPAWHACTTAHEKAYHLALDLWVQIESTIFVEAYHAGRGYERGPGFHLNPELVEEYAAEIRERVNSHDRLDYHAAKAEVERESAKALDAWKEETRQPHGSADHGPARGSQKGNAKKKGPSLRDRKIAARFAAGASVNEVREEFKISAVNARQIKSRAKALIARLKAELERSQPL